MERKVTKEELLAEAEKPAQDAMKMHPYYRGKIEIVPKCTIRDVKDFAIWYTPGVAEPCKDIEKNPESVFLHTNKANMVGIVTDGTRVLGLGRHRSHGRPARHGRQGPSFQVPGRRRCLSHLPRHEGPRRVHQNGQVPLPDFRRHQPRGYREPEVLLHPGEAAEGGARSPSGTTTSREPRPSPWPALSMPSRS